MSDEEIKVEACYKQRELCVNVTCGGQVKERRGSFSEAWGNRPSGSDPSSLPGKNGLLFWVGGQEGSRVAREPA